MQTQESREDLQRLVGELGQPIPKLSPSDKRRVRAFLTPWSRTGFQGLLKSVGVSLFLNGCC
jgi:hypothetical protein